MSQKNRILIGVGVLIALVAVVLGVEALRRRASPAASSAAEEPTLVPGGIPIRLDGRLVGSFVPADLEQLQEATFVDAEEGREQSGWLLRDVLLLRLEERSLQPDSLIAVGSSSRGKTAQLTWAEVQEPANSVMFDLSNRGTLKLVSLLAKLDTRDEWVQDVDSIEITSP